MNRTLIENIRPYNDLETAQAAKRLSQSSPFLELFSRLSGFTFPELQSKLSGINSSAQFIDLVYIPIIRAILEKISTSVTCSGMEQLSPDKSYLFLSNHRDIILDSAILDVLLQQQNLKQAGAAIGNNLLIYDWITDLVRSIRCVIVERNLSGRELISSSAARSAFIRDTILSGDHSLWISQKEGRTKDGNDHTQISLLKMLKMSGNPVFADNFRELHIVPLSISYEWEPCAELKCEELHLRSINAFTKTPGADMESMCRGLSSFKGKIHFAFSAPVNEELNAIAQTSSNNGERIQALGQYIDASIHGNYHCFPNHYIAYDQLYNTERFRNLYTEAQKELFFTTMNRLLDTKEASEELKQRYLQMYAAPVTNQTLTHK